MVLGCSVCSQPLVIRPNVDYKDPSLLMTKLRSNATDNDRTKTNFDINDAEIVATKCGHMFHKECLKKYLHGQSLMGLKSKPHGCPLCQKPVIQSQLWPVTIRATKEELLQIEKIKSLKRKNADLVAARDQIRKDTQKKIYSLEEARKKMFDCRIKLQGMDIESYSRSNLEKLEKQQEDLNKMLAAVTEQNLALTALVEHESVYGQKIRSEQTSKDSDEIDPLTRIVKQLTAQRIRKEGLVEKSARDASKEAKALQNAENSVLAAPDALQRWSQMKSSLAPNEKNVVQPFVRVKTHRHHSSQKHAQSSTKYNTENRDSMQNRKTRSKQRIGHNSRIRSRSSSPPAIPKAQKIATTGLGSDFWKMQSKLKNNPNPT